jgi:hypothetical protein
VSGVSYFNAGLAGRPLNWAGGAITYYTECVAPGNNPCQTFYVVQMAPWVLKLRPVSGSLQTIRAGESFQPLWVRVTNSATPPNPVMGAPVVFQSLIFLPDADEPVKTGDNGDGGSSQHAMKVLLGSSQNTSITDINGLATLAPATGGLSRPLEIEITASAGTSASLQFELPLLPALTPALGGSTGRARVPATTGGHRRYVRGTSAPAR